MTVTVNHLKGLLDQQYNLICFEDLGNLMGRSITGVYRCLKKNYKKKYLPNDRLIFYSKVPVSAEVIQHLIHGLEIFDIDPFFVVFCGETLDQSFDLGQIELTVSDGIEWKGTAPKLSFLCPLPWTSIQINNQGKLRPCCVFEGNLADIKETTIKEVFNGQDYKTIRNQLLNGEIPSGCKNCFKEESNNQMSNRQRSMATFQQEFLLNTIETPSIKNLDIRGGITCNMKCRICDESSSSLWLAEKTKNSITVIESSDWTKQKNQWDQIIDILPQCINLDFFGGEPLLNKQVLTLFELAKKKNFSKNIRLNINTNGSVWNPRFFDFFKFFKLVNIGISIDDIGDRFELQRGSSWHSVNENVKKFVMMNNQKFNAYIFTTINIQNVYYLPELLDWANNLNVTVLLSNLNNPRCLDIDKMTPVAKRIVVDKLSQHPDPRLKDIAHRVSKSSGSDGKEFLEYMLGLDQQRQQNFASSHQEIASAMGYSI